MQTERFTFFFKGPLSQWYPSVFYEDGVRFTNAECYMMYRKAMLFRDMMTADEILRVSIPSVQKKLGREVRGFNQETWDANKAQIVCKGNLLKFTSNPNLRDVLLETRGTTLVEASPYDRIWGIGLSETDPRRLNRSQWLGQNLLGECLMWVRYQLEEVTDEGL